MVLLVQIQAFLLTLVLGVIAGLIFHYYQLTIKNLRVGKYPLYAMDIILWIIMIIVIAAALLIINQGEMRVYVFIALLAGGLVYYKWLSQHIKQPLNVLGRATAFMLRAVYANLTRPMIWVIIWMRTRDLRRPSSSSSSPPPPDDLIQ